MYQHGISSGSTSLPATAEREQRQPIDNNSARILQCEEQEQSNNNSFTIYNLKSKSKLIIIHLQFATRRARAN
jgi:hypothetical protein